MWNELGEHQSAAADFTESIRLEPDLAGGYYQRGLVWNELGEHDKALADFDQAIARVVDGDTASLINCYRERARTYELLGRDDLADADDARADEITAGQENEENEGEASMLDSKHVIYEQVREHFGAAPLDQVSVTERYFPFRAGPELQIAMEQLQAQGLEVVQFHAVQQFGNVVSVITSLWTKDRRNPVLPGPPHYQEIDIGEDRPIRCLQDGLWLLRHGGTNFAVLLETYNGRGIHFEVAAPIGAAGEQATRAFFLHLENTVQKGACYRGKVLSLEFREMYSGQSQGIMVHRLRHVRREEVILPRQTLDLLDRNVIEFVRRRAQLAELGMATKKGLLFYGRPGMGKTHTIHYLTRCLPNHTTFLVTAEQIGMLSEYLTLAQLFRPSVVVIEDVDLIARRREELRSAIEESLLNRLLNEMDGLRPDAEIMFILTTNRPEALEEALAARPGRVDQAIEFPYPDPEGRAKLVRLYAGGLSVTEDIVQMIVTRTDQVSASFIKELMRRTAQFHFQRGGAQPVQLADVESALNELLIDGGSLNRKILGAGQHSGRLGF